MIIDVPHRYAPDMYRPATEVRPGDLAELAQIAKRAAEAKADLERAVVDAIHQGYSLRAIAEHAGISHMSVKRRVQRHFS